MCTAHVLMRCFHLIDRSFVCKAKEGRHIIISCYCYKCKSSYGNNQSCKVGLNNIYSRKTEMIHNI